MEGHHKTKLKKIKNKINSCGEPCVGIHYGTYLTLSRIRFTAKFDFAVSDRYSYEKMHTASLVRRDGIISALVTTSSPRLKAVVTCAEISPSRLPNDALGIYVHIL